jgi:hypothetical protein
MPSSFLGVFPILTPPLCALALSCAQSPGTLLTEVLTRATEEMFPGMPIGDD